MELFGVGGLELVAIFIIMLVVAGPKRMIQWSYTLGRYMSVLRNMWSETAAALQKELDAAGIEVQVPKDIPTRQNIRSEVAKMATPLTKPFQEGLNSVKTELDEVKQSVSIPPTNLNPTKPTVQKENGRPSSENGSTTSDAADFGTWSKGEQPSP
jgi:Sec-independent protein translocase protein TatA